MTQFENKTVVITGGTSGIGLATAQRFASDGARVYITGRRKETLDAAVAQIGGTVTGVQADSSNLDDLDRLYAKIEQDGHRIDVLHVNAGGGEFASLEAVTEKHFHSTFDNNVKGTLFTVQKALPLLNDGSSVILTGSTAATTGNKAFGVYGASKAAVRSFARTWAGELSTRGIRVNTVSPGPVDTPGIDGLAPGTSEAAALKQALADGVPLGRMGRTSEIADAVAFLASEQSTFVTGIELFVDGGTNQV